MNADLPEAMWRLIRGAASPLTPVVLSAQELGYLLHEIEKQEQVAELLRADVARLERASASVFDAIAHGDEEHRRWLKEKLDEHFASD